MKGMSKITAVGCAAALSMSALAGVAAPAFASTDAAGDPAITDTSIEISGTPTGVSGEHRFKAYRVGTYSNARVEDGILKGVDVTTNEKYASVASTALHGSAGVVDSDPLRYVATAFSDPQDNAKPWDSNPKLRAFADSLAKGIVSDDAEIEPDEVLVYNDQNRFFEVDEGIWLLVDDQGIDFGATIGSIPILVSTDASGASFDPEHPLGKVNLKNQNVPTVDLALAEKTDKGAFRIVEQPDFAIGQDFYTQVSTTIPSYTGYPLDGRIYSLALAFGEDGGEDGSGIEFDGKEVVATVTSVDGATVQRLEAGKDFDVTPGGIATIDFGKYVNGQGANKVLDGGSLTVDAKVRLTDAAAVSTSRNVAGNPITSSLSYSSTPTDLTHTAQACANAACAFGSEDNYVYAYTYGFGVTKTDKADPSELLGGAEFAVSGRDEKFVTASDGDAKGTVSVMGVDSGVQTVRETKAPQGYPDYALPSFSFEVKPTFVSGATSRQKKLQSVEYTDPQGDVLGLVSHDPGASDYRVANVKTIAQLPLTGGAGITAIVALAVGLGALGAGNVVKARLLKSARRRSADRLSA